MGVAGAGSLTTIRSASLYSILAVSPIWIPHTAEKNLRNNQQYTLSSDNNKNGRPDPAPLPRLFPFFLFPVSSSLVSPASL